MIARYLESDAEKIQRIRLKYVNRIDLSLYNIILKIRRVPIFDPRHFRNKQLNYSLLSPRDFLYAMGNARDRFSHSGTLSGSRRAFVEDRIPR